MEDENSKTLIYDGPYKEGIADGWVKVEYEDGTTFKGEFRDGKPFDGEMKYGYEYEYRCCAVFKGKFKDGKPSKGKEIHTNGKYFKGEWENDKPLNVFIKIKLSKAGNSYSFFRRGKNNLMRKVEYLLKDNYSKYKVVTIDYGEINRTLNEDSSKINNLDDLIKNRVIEGVENFNELKEFSKKVLQDKNVRRY